MPEQDAPTGAECRTWIRTDEHVVGLVVARAERDGRIVELPRVHVWLVREGRLSELWLHPTDQVAFDSQWR